MILTITWDHWQKQDIVKADLYMYVYLQMCVCCGGISKKGRMVKEGAGSKDDELRF